MGLDGPALIFTCCHSALAARTATGAPTVTAVTLRVVRAYLWVPFRATGLRLDDSEMIFALLTLPGVNQECENMRGSFYLQPCPEIRYPQVCAQCARRK